MIEGFIRGVSICGPGLDGWIGSRPILAGLQNYVPHEVQPAPVTMLSANERRRTGVAVRLALAVAQQASEMAGVAPGSIPSVFATSNGDGAVIHAILETLAAGAAVSPTQFHNSVHNAAAGYWSIATGSQQPASCITGHDATAATALLKALAAVQVEQQPILLCIYDAPMPTPLEMKRPTRSLFGVGLVLGPEPGEADLAAITVDYRAPPVTSENQAPRLPALRALALGNPAARLLRLLEALARGVPDTMSLDLLDGRLEVNVRPCSRTSRYAT